MIFTLDLPCSDFDFPSAALAGHNGPDAAEGSQEFYFMGHFFIRIFTILSIMSKM